LITFFDFFQGREGQGRDHPVIEFPPELHFLQCVEAIMSILAHQYCHEDGYGNTFSHKAE